MTRGHPTLQRRTVIRSVVVSAALAFVSLVYGYVQVDAAELYGWVTPPMANVTIMLCSENAPAKATPNPATTDSRGYYRFQAVAPGSYMIYIGGTMCGGAGQAIFVEPGVTRLDLKSPGK